jgi:hypothetical protein
MGLKFAAGSRRRRSSHRDHSVKVSSLELDFFFARISMEILAFERTAVWL